MCARVCAIDGQCVDGLSLVCIWLDALMPQICWQMFINPCTAGTWHNGPQVPT